MQLLSHLEDDALNVALLVPESRRATRVGLVGALTEHYGSPGRLADYRHQFERTTRTAGEDQSLGPLETRSSHLATWAKQHRDRFIAGHDSCELRRHLDSV